MSLITQIKKERLSARKEKNKVKASILTTLSGELESRAKRDGSEITDEMVISTAKKFIQSNLDTMKSHQCEIGIHLFKEENAVLESFLPKQLTQEQIVDIINELGSNNIGEIMKHFKANYLGQYDGKVVNNIVRMHLS